MAIRLLVLGPLAALGIMGCSADTETAPETDQVSSVELALTAKPSVIRPGGRTELVVRAPRDSRPSRGSDSYFAIRQPDGEWGWVYALSTRGVGKGSFPAIKPMGPTTVVSGVAIGREVRDIVKVPNLPRGHYRISKLVSAAGESKWLHAKIRIRPG